MNVRLPQVHLLLAMNEILKRKIERNYPKKFLKSHNFDPGNVGVER
jgi:hypothetical protein